MGKQESWTSLRLKVVKRSRIRSMKAAKPKNNPQNTPVKILLHSCPLFPEMNDDGGKKTVFRKKLSDSARRVVPIL
ncbi:MAG: hypothetical protein EOP86_26675 [Verrucomicrobiaceae bacterium]|nr:MAG: hypothetical protein EOP86_26675 [Verrucomicrobiaceae bacterium]